MTPATTQQPTAAERLSATFGPDEIEALHECADRLAENGFHVWASAVSEAACICAGLMKAQSGCADNAVVKPATPPVPAAVGDSAPEPCTDLSITELIEWLYQPQYINGILDPGTVAHMESAARLIERLRATPPVQAPADPICQWCGHRHSTELGTSCPPVQAPAAGVGNRENELHHFRARVYTCRQVDGLSHNTACTIWGDDGQGGTKENYEQPLPCNCGALRNAALTDREAAARADEREQCAKVAEDFDGWVTFMKDASGQVSKSIAAAIRARTPARPEKG